MAAYAKTEGRGVEKSNPFIEICGSALRAACSAGSVVRELSEQKECNFQKIYVSFPATCRGIPREGRRFRDSGAASRGGKGENRNSGSRAISDRFPVRARFAVFLFSGLCFSPRDTAYRARRELPLARNYGGAARVGGRHSAGERLSCGRGKNAPRGEDRPTPRNFF